MLRKFAYAVLSLVLVVGVLVAAEIKGKVKSVDAEKNTITVTDQDGKDVTVTYNDDTKFVGGKNPIDREKAIKGLSKGGREVTITTEKKGDKEVATEVKMMGGKKKDKGDK